MERGTKLVLEQVVTTIASVADTSEEKFLVYYDRFMPCLKYIIQNATTPELRLLRGKTIECVSLIGLAVGAETFTQDASQVRSSFVFNAEVCREKWEPGIGWVCGLLFGGAGDGHAAQVAGRGHGDDRRRPAVVVHDLGVGAHLQDPRQTVPAVPARRHGARPQGRLHEARGRPPRLGRPQIRRRFAIFYSKKDGLVPTISFAIFLL